MMNLVDIKFKLTATAVLRAFFVFLVFGLSPPCLFGVVQVMMAEKNRDIGRMTMARALAEKDAEQHIQRIQGGLGRVSWVYVRAFLPLLVGRAAGLLVNKNCKL